MTTPKTVSLTAPETHSLTQSHHPTPPLTCTVSPVSPSLKGQSRVSLTSLTPLRGETPRLTETETNHSHQPPTHPARDGGQG